MARFVVQRVLAAVAILGLVSFVTFLLFFAIPGDPARLSCGKTCTPERLADIRRSLGIDRPVLTQYVDYMQGIFAGRDFTQAGEIVRCDAPCFGYSFTNQQPVWETLLDRAPGHDLARARRRRPVPRGRYRAGRDLRVAGRQHAGPPRRRGRGGRSVDADLLYRPILRNTFAVDLGSFPNPGAHRSPTTRPMVRRPPAALDHSDHRERRDLHAPDARRGHRGPERGLRPGGPRPGTLAATAPPEAHRPGDRPPS